MQFAQFIRSQSIGLIAAIMVSSPALAESYHCKFTEQGRSNYIPQELIADYDASTGAVTVNDTMIQYYVGKPIQGVMKSHNSTRALMTWTLPKVKNSSGQYTAGFTFNLNILRASGEASITAKPQGYSNSFRGQGSCTIK
ncbi:MAG: hypothetical protein P8X77_05860 [Maritimibacter sp.]